MKLELFDFIDDTLSLIDKNIDSLESVSKQLEKFFHNSLCLKDHFLNVNSRIKSKESLREKILRYNFYIKYENPEKLLDNLSDLIGIRIECRFIEDEKKIYRDIVKLFSVEEEDGYYGNPLNAAIKLKIDEEQPQVQKNGFKIYKIDGRYLKNGVKFNFELQIKSLVNVFWGDIDHRILYKNFNYMLVEDFFVDIMSSIKDSLTMIDRQLMVVYNHLNEMDSSDVANKRVQLKSLLSKIIHDIYISKVKEDLGFVIDFKKQTDVIVNYIFMKDEPDQSVNYSENFLRVLNRLNQISNETLDFNKYIDFERKIFYSDEFTRKIGSKILNVINRDFKWNLFFKIIFEIEEKNKAEDFEGFVIYLRYIFHKSIMDGIEDKNFPQEHREEIVHCILDSIADNFNDEIDINYINECSILKLNKKISQLLKDIDSYDTWLENKESIVEKVLNHEI